MIDLSPDMYDAAQDEIGYLLQTDEIRADFRKALQALLAIVERDRPDPVEALRAAYWKLRGHASSYRGTGVFQRRQESFRADPDNAVLARGAARDEWYARGIEAAAEDLAELLAAEYGADIDPDPDGAP